MTVYMLVDLQHKELPLAVTDTAEEMAELCGLSRRNSVFAAIWRAERYGYPCRYVRVQIDDDEEG